MALVDTALSLVISGCSATQHLLESIPVTSDSTITSTPSSRPLPSQPGYGTDVGELARQIPGCGSPAPLDGAEIRHLAPAVAPVVAVLATAASTTSCTLRGNGVLVVRFADGGAQARALTALKSVEQHLADGLGWAAVPVSTDEPAQELSVVQAVAQSLGGQLVAGSG